MKALLKKNDVFSFGNSNTLYVVTQTEMKGGGIGHGPHDVYPDGHYVTARKILRKDTLGDKKEFYQTGCFNGMYPPEKITLVGKAKLETRIVAISIKA
jgi:hypothetical protein